jgi:pantothenate kinase type III
VATTRTSSSPSSLRERRTRASNGAHVTVDEVTPDRVRDIGGYRVRRFLFEVNARVLVGTGMKTGLKNRYDDPAAVGADRIVNAVAVGKHYGFPAIIVDIGTATSVEAVSG